MLSTRMRLAGPGALLLAPVLAIAPTLARPNLSDDAANQFAALTNHRGAMIAGLALSTIAVVLLTAGIIWLALMLAQRAPGLVIPGAVLGVFGSLVVVFLNGVGAAAPTIVHELDPRKPYRRFTTSSQARRSQASSRSSFSVTSESPYSGLPP